uniref:Uncharacterized protein n=1 Tax=Lactuca sativa TaxID=4236 RepID=A0A9R1X5L0_LACSA|nr:hypothetical protein LSAT_V11C700365480 [Lactuca sativa]
MLQLPIIAPSTPFDSPVVDFLSSPPARSHRLLRKTSGFALPHLTDMEETTFSFSFSGFEEALPNGTKMRHDFVLPINYYTLQFSSAYSVDSRIHLPQLLTYSSWHEIGFRFDLFRF